MPFPFLLDLTKSSLRLSTSQLTTG